MAFNEVFRINFKIGEKQKSVQVCEVGRWHDWNRGNSEARKFRSWEIQRVGSLEDRKFEVKKNEVKIMERKKDLKHFRDLEVYQLSFKSAMRKITVL
ncbi:MAG: hypothetical protein Q8M94_19350 [Ignavibacteria bacterium]|nr:hypothetical protein [Ignavibacteria bacterium]